MIVLMLGSGPNVLACRDWPRAAFDRLVTINNAWAVRPDWDDLVYPDDFPPDRHPVGLKPGQTLVSSGLYIPENNRYGGIIYAGATMAFTASYWALGALRPRVIAYLGCDMVYGEGRITHFYGRGMADPLRPDPTLQNLRAKSARLELLAARDGCALVNLSAGSERSDLSTRGYWGVGNRHTLHGCCHAYRPRAGRRAQAERGLPVRGVLGRSGIGCSGFGRNRRIMACRA